VRSGGATSATLAAAAATSSRAAVLNEFSLLSAATTTTGETPGLWSMRNAPSDELVDLRPTMRALLQLSGETEMRPLVSLMTRALVDVYGARRAVLLLRPSFCSTLLDGRPEGKALLVIAMASTTDCTMLQRITALTSFRGSIIDARDIYDRRAEPAVVSSTVHASILHAPASPVRQCRR